MTHTVVNKEAIIAEYLTGETTFRELSAKYGVDYRTIHYWVSCYQGKIKAKPKVAKKGLQTQAKAEELPDDIKKLQSELRRSKLHAEVLEEMLKLSEALTGIELRKKFGTRRF